VLIWRSSGHRIGSRTQGRSHPKLTC